ncbi:MAG: LTA synthase family protein, partial [Syntrophothermus sp.]
LVPFFFLCLWKKNAGLVFLLIVYIFYGIIELMLFNYYILALVPLDHVVYAYTFRELIMIAGTSGELNLMGLWPALVFLAVTFVLFYLLRKIYYKKSQLQTIAFFALVAGILTGDLLFIRKPGRDAQSFVTINKTSFFLTDCIKYWGFGNNSSPDEKHILEVALKYQEEHDEFDFLGPQYPFLHEDDTPDVLSPYLNLNPEKPNFVFVIVESLSSCFMGQDAFCGSFTPFLDSLAGKSLYWPGCLSTCERTFNALPAVFGSLPPGNPNSVIESGNFPRHLSSIRILKEEGYFTSFFYGGNSNFDHMKTFLDNQGMDYYVNFYGNTFPGLIDGKPYVWGHPDHEVFARSLEVMDSVKRNPRLDIYLTLATHTPFIPPDLAYYKQKALQRIRSNGPRQMPAKLVNENLQIFATVLYADHSLQQFFEAWKKKPAYRNTIFIITGDHGMSELNMRQYSELEKYHVPLIIYSPMLKEPRKMESLTSHLDITPSILALMENQYGFVNRYYYAWMGTGLDTVKNFRSTRRMGFMRGNRDINEYLNNDFYLDQENLYQVGKGLKLIPIRDSIIANRLKNNLVHFRELNYYITRKNLLIPQSVFEGRVVRGVKIKLRDKVYFTETDSTSLYRLLVNCDSIPAGFRYFDFELNLEMLCHDTDPDKIPKVVFDMCDYKGQSLSWNTSNIPPVKMDELGKWHKRTVTAHYNFRLPPGEHYLLKMYLMNCYGSTTRFRNPRIVLTAYN